MTLKTLTLLVFLLSQPLSAEPERWEFTWDRQLPAMELRDVHIQGKSLQDAWREVTALHMLRCVLVVPEGVDVRLPFEFTAASCRGKELLDALCKHHDYQWTADEDTGVIWLEPPGMNFPALEREIVLTESLVNVPMHTGVIQPYFWDAGLAIVQGWMDHWLNSFDYLVSIDAGTYPIRSLLSQCLVWKPSITFYVVEDAGGRLSVLDVNIPLSDKKRPMEGAQLFWELESGPAAFPVSVDSLIDALCSDSPRERWAAQNYINMTAWTDGNLRKAHQSLARSIKSDKQVKALFSLLQAWVPRTAVPRELAKNIREALASERLETLSEDSQLRLLALGAAISQPGASREAVLEKLPTSAEQLIANADFDVQGFLNTHPGLEFELRKAAGAKAVR